MRKTGLFLSLTISFAILPHAHAQFLQSGNQSGNPGFKRETIHTIEKSISIPEVPVYPGAKFISGEEAQPSSQIVCGYTLDYAVPKSSDSQVIPYYANLFNGGGWKINQQTPNSIDASNEKNNSHCNICCDGGDKKTSKLHINYVVTPKATYSGEQE